MPKFRKKPIVVDAEQWLGPQSWPMRGVYRDPVLRDFFVITAQNKEVTLTDGDWVILEKDQPGDKIRSYPCAADVFAETYDPE